MAQCMGLNGLLLLSGYCEPTVPDTTGQMMEIGLQSLREHGLNEDQLGDIRNTHNKVVCSIDSNQVFKVLTFEVLTPALQLYQALVARAWAFGRQGEGFNAAPAFQSVHEIKDHFRSP